MKFARNLPSHFGFSAILVPVQSCAVPARVNSYKSQFSTSEAKKTSSTDFFISMCYGLQSLFFFWELTWDSHENYLINMRIINTKENKRWNSCIILTSTTSLYGGGEKKTWCETKEKSLTADNSTCAHFLKALILTATVKANFATTCQEMSHYCFVFIYVVNAGLKHFSFKTIH